MQCVTPDIGMAFQAVENSLWDMFVPDLFQKATSQIHGRAITGLPVKQARIALSDPTRTAEANRTEYFVIKGHLVAALRRIDEFRSVYHALLMGERKDEIWQRHTE